MSAPSGTVPVLVLKEGTGRATGREAQRNNIMAAKTVAETVKTTLGPRGMDKMLVSSIGDVTITNDGATIMKELDVQHPAAKMLVEVAKAQDNEVGDGTTTAVVFAVVVGVCVGLVSGFVENRPGGVTIPENKYYGYPLIWRLIDAFAGEKYYYFELLVDCIFWIAIILIVGLLTKKLIKG